MSRDRISDLKLWISKPHNALLVLIILISFFISIHYFFLTKNQPLWWDESEYMLKAKNIAFGTPDTGWFEARAILLPVIGAAFFRLGLGEIGLRFIYMLMSVGVVFLTYYVGKEIFGKNVGLISAFIMSVFYLNTFYTSRLLADMPQVLFALGGAALFVKSYFGTGSKKLIYWVLPILFLGALVRFTVGLFIIVLLIFLLFTEGLNLFKKKEWYLSTLFGFIIFVPYVVYSGIKYGNPFYVIVYNLASNAPNKAANVNPWGILMQYISYSPSYMNILLYLLFLAGFLAIAASIALKYDLIRGDRSAQKGLFLLFWIIVPMVYFSFFWDHFEDRYIFILFPSVFIVTGFALDKLQNILSKYGKTFAVIVVVGLLVFSGYGVFASGDRIIKNSISSYDSLKAAGLWIKANSNPKDIVFSAGVPENTYYSERQTYGIPNTEDEFLKQINEKKPKYLILTVWEKSPQWSYAWPDNNTALVSVAQAYFTDATRKTPTTIIYQFQHPGIMANVNGSQIS